MLNVDRDDSILTLMHGIARGDQDGVSAAIARDPDLAHIALQQGATRATPEMFFLPEITHYVYAGDTSLHVAAAAHRADLVDLIISADAAVNAVNRRRATPLHYACDGGPAAAGWDPQAQRRTVELLVSRGANLDASDKSGTTPILRAIRNRCADAVDALLAAGADPGSTNARGTSAITLATITTGKSGAGSDLAKQQKQRILDLLAASGRHARPT